MEWDKYSTALESQAGNQRLIPGNGKGNPRCW